MAKYDYGAGCPCGLYRECEPHCEYKEIKMSWDNVGPNHCNMDGTPIVRETRVQKEIKMQEHDFGFSFADSTELTAEIDTATEKLEKLRAMILPFLKNLKQNPEKDIIKWNGKDRIKKIDEFIGKINVLVDS
jgi:hypothetical protein